MNNALRFDHYYPAVPLLCGARRALEYTIDLIEN
jgi:hypothetical protein